MTRIDRLFKAFADPTRRRILNLLRSRRSLCVCHLIDALGQPQPTVSRHLATLKRAGVVADRKEGPWRHYSLAAPRDPNLARLLACLPRRADAVRQEAKCP